jgi:hypothetical protein
MQAVARADIVVLDWSVHNDDGETALDIISRLWTDQEGHDRLRLVAIYTGSNELRRIVEKVAECLTGLGVGRTLRDGPFVRIKGNLRVAVLAKKYAKFPRSAKRARKQVTSEAELPDRLVSEFARLTAGIVPSVALVSLAAIRENAQRLLNSLDRTLDPAYLWHRAMLADPADAEDQLVELIAAEIQSVLEDAQPGKWADIDSLRLWVSAQNAAKFQHRFGTNKSLTEADLTALLSVGVDGAEASGGKVRDRFPGTNLGTNRKSMAAFAPTMAESARSDARLAGLMSLRTRYSNPVPRLWLGVITATGRGKGVQYWLCLQPRCDAVRLPDSRPFPMLPLAIANDTEGFHVVLSAEHNHRRLVLRRKPAHLQMVTFAPTAEMGSVMADPFGKSGYRFRAVSGRSKWYRFAGELQPAHAQRIVNAFAADFSDVGLNESEWLRRWSRSA